MPLTRKTPILTVDRFEKRYGDKVAVRNLTLTVEAGDIYGFIGHNGAGKTTLIRSIVGAQPFEGGSIDVCGVDVTVDPVAAKRQLAYVPDNPDIYTFMTGIQYLTFIADIFEVSADERAAILAELFGTSGPQVFIEPNLRCDYGFNVHFHGLAVVNYDCCFLDTSPIRVGAGAFIAPGCVLACAGHAVDPDQRAAGVQTSAPITLGENVWLGANVTVCGGVTIGDGSVVGAGSVVTRDVPSGVVAAGVPCRVIRPIDNRDRVEPFDPVTGSSS